MTPRDRSGPRSSNARRAAGLLLALSSAATLGGCWAANLAGALGQAYEDQKLIEVLPKYEGLQGKTVAVIVDAGLDVLYQYPNAVAAITAGVTNRIGQNVEGVRVVRPDAIIQWQWRTPEWNAMPYGEMATALGVDRVVVIDVYEYRLNPPGNVWLWEGVAAATVGVVERDGLDPDGFVDTFDVAAQFPTIQGVDRDAATQQQIETGVLAEFIKKTAWLFYLHTEPKHPDRYRPELES